MASPQGLTHEEVALREVAGAEGDNTGREHQQQDQSAQIDFRHSDSSDLNGLSCSITNIRALIGSEGAIAE